MRVEAEHDFTDCSGTITQFQINNYNTKWRPNLTVRISYQRSDISPSLTSLFTLEFKLQNSWVMALPSRFLPLHFKALSFGQSQTFRVSILYFALSNPHFSIWLDLQLFWTNSPHPNPSRPQCHSPLLSLPLVPSRRRCCPINSPSTATANVVQFRCWALSSLVSVTFLSISK